MMPELIDLRAEACPTAEATLQSRTSGSSRSRSAALEQLAVPHAGQQGMVRRSTTAMPTLTGPASAPAAYLVARRPGSAHPRGRKVARSQGRSYGADWFSAGMTAMAVTRLSLPAARS